MPNFSFTLFYETAVRGRANPRRHTKRLTVEAPTLDAACRVAVTRTFGADASCDLPPIMDLQTLAARRTYAVARSARGLASVGVAARVTDIQTAVAQRLRFQLRGIIECDGAFGGGPEGWAAIQRDDEDPVYQTDEDAADVIAAVTGCPVKYFWGDSDNDESPRLWAPDELPAGASFAEVVVPFWAADLFFRGGADVCVDVHCEFCGEFEPECVCDTAESAQ